MSPVYAVIPSAVVLGPLAVLAAVFPGAAAVLSVILKRWRAFLSVVGVNSTLVAVVAFWRPGWLWILYGVLSVLTTLGLIWAGVRYRKMVEKNPAFADPPTIWNVIRLSYAVFGVAALMFTPVFWGQYGIGWKAMWEAGTLSASLQLAIEFCKVAIALQIAQFYMLYRWEKHKPGSLSLSEEFVALLVLLVLTLAFFPHKDRSGSPNRVDPVTPDEINETADGPLLASARVLFRTEEMDEVMSAPVVSGKRVYFGAAKLTAFGEFGAVYAVDAETGAVAWRFDHGGTLRPVYATPAVANGLVYCGEGLHSDAECSLYALKADSGEVAWSIPTASHTEGTPTVTGNRVYFCAGDDGLFCSEAGKVVWHREGSKNRLHVDSPPAVANGRVYVGSGYRTWAVFALDANTGDELWRVPETLRSFGPPLVLGSRVAFGLGTGNLTDDLMREPEEGEPEEKSPAGVVLCVDGTDGKVAWRTPLPRSVHTGMAADAFRVYAACRDGCVYALDRQTGAVRWRRPVGTALVAGPVAVTAFGGGATLAVYTVTEEGLAVCLNPQTGAIVWTKDLSELAGGRVKVLSSPAVVSIDSTGRRAVFVGGSVTDRSTGRAAAVVFRLEDAVHVD
jgi:outer membrane protein assembly factor BamB